MDWTIVASVLVALLLWPVILASVGALTLLTAATVLRGRAQRLFDRQMASCKRMFSSWQPAASAGPAAGGPCPCGESPEGS